ncbi:hypothetical protein HDU97_005210 [Phlyctochytrium planicorne]|nr:hypothetical protein HDU97_005210 [Phlyctochytrium planicorne]
MSTQKVQPEALEDARLQFARTKTVTLVLNAMEQQIRLIFLGAIMSTITLGIARLCQYLTDHVALNVSRFSLESIDQAIVYGMQAAILQETGDLMLFTYAQGGLWGIKVQVFATTPVIFIFDMATILLCQHYGGELVIRKVFLTMNFVAYIFAMFIWRYLVLGFGVDDAIIDGSKVSLIKVEHKTFLQKFSVHFIGAIGNAAGLVCIPYLTAYVVQAGIEYKERIEFIVITVIFTPIIEVLVTLSIVKTTQFFKEDIKQATSFLVFSLMLLPSKVKFEGTGYGLNWSLSLLSVSASKVLPRLIALYTLQRKAKLEEERDMLDAGATEGPGDSSSSLESLQRLLKSTAKTSAKNIAPLQRGDTKTRPLIEAAMLNSKPKIAVVEPSYPFKHPTKPIAALEGEAGESDLPLKPPIVTIKEEEADEIPDNIQVTLSYGLEREDEESLESLPSLFKKDGQQDFLVDTSAGELMLKSTMADPAYKTRTGFNRTATVRSKTPSLRPSTFEHSIAMSRKVEDVVLNMAAPTIVSNFETFYESTRMFQALSDYLTLFLGTGIVWMCPSYFEVELEMDMLWIFLVFIALSVVLEVVICVVEYRYGN